MAKFDTGGFLSGLAGGYQAGAAMKRTRDDNKATQESIDNAKKTVNSVDIDKLTQFNPTMSVGSTGRVSGQGMTGTGTPDGIVRGRPQDTNLDDITKFKIGGSL